MISLLTSCVVASTLMVAGADPPVRAAVSTPSAAEIPTDEDCRALVRRHAREEAVACYAARATLDGIDGVVAVELADVVGRLRLAPPDVLDAATAISPSASSMQTFLSDGRVEFLAASTLGGAAVAILMNEVAARTTGSVNGASVFLAPVAGGLMGLGVGAATIALWPSMSVGDALLMRSMLLLGGVDGVLAAALLSRDAPPSSQAPLLTAAGLIVGGGALGGTLGVFTDLPEGASALALSGSAWTSVLAVLGTWMFDLQKTSTTPDVDFLRTLAVTTNLGFAAGLGIGAVVPITRAETWAMDVGGAVGFLAGAALAVTTRAPTPFLGWGSMAAGTVMGMGAGLAAARHLPQGLAALGAVLAQVQPVPLVLPGPSASPSAITTGIAMNAAF